MATYQEVKRNADLAMMERSKIIDDLHVCCGKLSSLCKHTSGQAQGWIDDAAWSIDKAIAELEENQG